MINLYPLVSLVIASTWRVELIVVEMHSPNSGVWVHGAADHMGDAQFAFG